jgi:ferrochelatase
MKKRAILLANLGSPDSYEVRDVKTYLKEFLMDERVIDIPYLIRYPLVNGIIVPFRAAKSAERYRSIWTENGSPLVHITEQLTDLLEEKSHLPVYMCMRYGHPAPKDVLKEIAIEQSGLEELVLLPLYPHYAMSSYETAVEHIRKAYHAGGYTFELKVVPPFYNHPEYINALATSIKPYLQGTYDHILFSYHGIPERHILKSDITGNHCLKNADCCSVSSAAHQNCYRHQVIETTKLVAQQLQLPEAKFSFSFQSRLGKDKWLQPDTAVLLKEFPEKGIRKLLVVCPAFVSDCLETLEEIEVEGKELFMQSGGESFAMIPCLNTQAEWISTINTLVNN